MTNQMIILIESIKLMEEGILVSSGVAQTIDGKLVDIPEQIHTYQAWKKLGFQVKRGEKAIAQFPVWKYSSKKIKDEATDEEKEKGNCYLRTASFFKFSQVEKVEVK